ncbi:MAG: GGDEF domain-containing protein, partial [Desulfobacula sp.]|nr:GGDEF domain-containing protein [Desulfobacula sp.]
MSSANEERLMTLQEQVKKLQSQKDTLLKELDGVEERFDHMNRLYRKFFPVIIDTLATSDTSFSKTCKDLGAALKKGESEGKIEYIFEQIKTAMLKEDIGPVALKKKKGLFSSILKNSSVKFIDEYKQSYHDVLNNLRSTLDKKYFRKLDTLTSLINTAEDTNDISDIRESVFSLIFVYISDTNQDRDQVNSFVREVVGKILDIESRLANTYQQTETIFQANDDFESVLQTQMGGLKQTTDVAKSLEELKIQVSKHLASIENALTKKQVKDKAIKEVAQKNRNAFKSGFAKLKLELDEATRYSEELEKKLNQDQLTGAFNRRAYDKQIEQEMARFLRYGSNFSLLIIDADRFKRINDNYGHAIGDKCLKEIIKRSIPLLRKNDMLARYGGEEFTVIMPETEAEGA